jgi:hypothetical protein
MVRRIEPTGKIAARAPMSDRVYYVNPYDLRPAHVNGVIYKDVGHDDPAVVALAENIKAVGRVLEALVVTRKGKVVVSGHRRLAAAKIASLAQVPVRYVNIDPDDPEFERLLVSFNDQRVKSAAEQIREEIVRTRRNDAYENLLNHHKLEQAKAYQRIEDSGLRVLDQSPARRRARITEVKWPMLAAVAAILNQYRDYWPLTLRQIHYRMLIRNVLRNAKVADSLYRNTQNSYGDLPTFAFAPV